MSNFNDENYESDGENKRIEGIDTVDMSEGERLTDAPISDEPLFREPIEDEEDDEVVPFVQTKAFKILLASTAAFLLFLFAIVYFISGDDPETNTVAVDQLTSEQQRAIDAEQIRQEQLQTVQPVISNLPINDYVLSTEPIGSLATQSTANLMTEIPEYTNNGIEVLTADGRFMNASDPYLAQSQNEVYNMTEAYITGNRILEYRTLADGSASWYIRTGQGFEDIDYVPITDVAAANTLRLNMRQYAAQAMRDKLNTAPWQTRQSPIANASNAPVIEQSLSTEERDRLLSMVEAQRNNNLELVRANKELREERQEVKSKVVELVQRIEDNPKVGLRLRATTIPPESGWKVTAINGDRIYLISTNTNEIVSLTLGDKLPDSSLIVSHVDESTGIVLVTPK